MYVICSMSYTKKSISLLFLLALVLLVLAVPMYNNDLQRNAFHPILHN